jgi:glycosyltransferase involved in cell wall biosynthesis
MKCILFVHNGLTRFVRIDRDLLAERYTITERHETSLRGLRPLEIRRAVKAHDLVFGWFASWHTLLPILFARQLGRPSVVVVGGYDTANVPEANYGSQRGGVRKFVARTVIRSATRLIVNSDAAGREAVTNAGADADRISMIYHGVDPVPAGPMEGREPIVLTVGNVWRENLLRKGLLPFVQSAGFLPDVRFVHIGRWCDDGIEELRRAAGPNVEFLGTLSDEELYRWYARASVYVQASLHEGFGLSVAEAMSAGCVPVVTRVGSLPEVASPGGIYVKSPDPREIADAIRRALACNGQTRRDARSHVLTEFPMERRRAALDILIQTLAGEAAPKAGRTTLPKMEATAR